MNQGTSDNTQWKPSRKARQVLRILLVGHIVLCLVFYNWAHLNVLPYIGWAILGLSILLGWLPRRALRAKGKAPEGRSWIHTSVVVDSGIYAVVRHPMYLSYILFIASLILISQHWSSLIIGIPMIIFYYCSAKREEPSSIRKFGDDYLRYMKRVPRLNIIWGIIKLLCQRKPNSVS